MDLDKEENGCIVVLCGKQFVVFWECLFGRWGDIVYQYWVIYYYEDWDWQYLDMRNECCSSWYKCIKMFFIYFIEQL